MNGIGEDEENEIFPKEHHSVERNVKNNTKLCNNLIFNYIQDCSINLIV